MTQAERLVCALRRGWFTYSDMVSLYISACPWKRLSESGARYLRPNEVLAKKTGIDGLIRFSVRKVRQSVRASKEVQH